MAETPVESNGQVFRLGDIATVRHGFVDPTSYEIRQEGKPALGIGVVTAKGANDHIAPAVLANLPTTPEHMEGALRIDDQFWLDNLDRLSQRFNNWLSR